MSTVSPSDHSQVGEYDGVDHGTLQGSGREAPESLEEHDPLVGVDAHLRAASRALGQLVATSTDGDDGPRFAAINDADRLVRCALVALSDLLHPFESDSVYYGSEQRPRVSRVCKHNGQSPGRV